MAVYEMGVPTDPDLDDVTLEVTRDSDQAVIVPPGTLAGRDGVGLYSHQLNSGQTQTTDSYTETWSYTVAGSSRVYVGHYTITGPMPYWDQLTANERDIVMSVYARISNTWDSRQGGPNLWDMYQLNYNAFEVIARIMSTEAMIYINFSSPPLQNFQIGAAAQAAGQAFNISTWGGILEQVTYWSTLKDISRSYIETISASGLDVVHVDRSAYRAAWEAEAQNEEPLTKRMVQLWKRQFLLGVRNALLIGGGSIPYLYSLPSQPHWRYAVSRY